MATRSWLLTSGKTFSVIWRTSPWRQPTLGNGSLSAAPSTFFANRRADNRDLRQIGRLNRLAVLAIPPQRLYHLAAHTIQGKLGGHISALIIPIVAQIEHAISIVSPPVGGKRDCVNPLGAVNHLGHDGGCSAPQASPAGGCTRGLRNG